MKRLKNVFNGFGEVTPQINISRSVIPMNPTMQTSYNLGELIPIFCMECIAGDGISCNMSMVEYMTNLKRPIMGNINTDTYFFFVPMRLLWKDWETFFGAEKGPSAWKSDKYKNSTVPMLEIDSTNPVKAGDIANHLGLPAGYYGRVNHLPFRALAHIVNDWFINMNVEPPQFDAYDTNTTLSKNGLINSDIHRIAIGDKPWIAYKYADLFTRALRAPQKGDPVTLNLGDLAMVRTLSNDDAWTEEDIKNNILNGSQLDGLKLGEYTGHAILNRNKALLGVNNNETELYPNNSTALSTNSVIPTNLVADLSTASAITVNAMRTAFAIQKILERYARAGCNRYTEVLSAIYGVSPADYRLQRAEYIGGARHAVGVQTVVQNSESNTTPLGHLAAFSKTVSSGDSWHYEVQEPGYIIGVMVSRQQHIYSQYVPDQFKVKTRFDFYNPALANIGEQPIEAKTLYWKDTTGNVFGYQEAWWNYRYMPSAVSGMLDPNAGENALQNWTIADSYNSTPTLSAEWLKETPEYLDRCLQFTHETVDQFIADIYFDIKAHRPMPAYSIPGLIDHN